MELVILIVVVYVIFKFNRLITSTVKAVEKVSYIADDTVVTYADDVHIMNAGKRSEQKTALETMEEIVTSEEIRVLLKRDK